MLEYADSTHDLAAMQIMLTRDLSGLKETDHNVSKRIAHVGVDPFAAFRAKSSSEQADDFRIGRTIQLVCPCCCARSCTTDAQHGAVIFAVAVALTVVVVDGVDIGALFVAFMCLFSFLSLLCLFFLFVIVVTVVVLLPLFCRPSPFLALNYPESFALVRVLVGVVVIDAIVFLTVYAV